MRAKADSGTVIRHEAQSFHFQIEKSIGLIYLFSSALSLQENNLVPVFRFYASGIVPLPCRVALHPGLNGKNRISFLGFSRRHNSVRKPNGSGSPEA
jgi:hypothetical protein